MPFPIQFKSDYIGELEITSSQYLVCHSNDTQSINDFLQWIEGKKFSSTESVSFNHKGLASTNLYELRKYIAVLRYLPVKKQSSTFYQQRYHATENDDLITIGEYIGAIEEPYFKEMAIKLDLMKLMDEKINMLSTGEFKKSMTLKTMLYKPKLLIVEEPGLGIDPDSRQQLHQLFEHLQQQGSSIIVFTSTNMWPYEDTNRLELKSTSLVEDMVKLEDITVPDVDYNFKSAFKLVNIVACYNNRNILKHINWEVIKDSKWALTGKNGAGKSTLLSFVYADNPQSYSNVVYIFDQKRGVGHSIWDIKERIGFYSSEYQTNIDKQQQVEVAIQRTALQNPYKKRTLSDKQLLFKEQLLHYFNLEELTSKRLYTLSPVNQRLVILCGVLIKNAPLLILDEPFQGFSESLVQKAQALIEKYTINRTLIMVSHNNQNFPKCINRRFHLTDGYGEELEFKI